MPVDLFAPVSLRLPGLVHQFKTKFKYKKTPLRSSNERSTSPSFFGLGTGAAGGLLTKPAQATVLLWLTHPLVSRPNLPRQVELVMLDLAGNRHHRDGCCSLFFILGSKNVADGHTFATHFVEKV